MRVLSTSDRFRQIAWELVKKHGPKKKPQFVISNGPPEQFHSIGWPNGIVISVDRKRMMRFDFDRGLGSRLAGKRGGCLAEASIPIMTAGGRKLICDLLEKVKAYTDK